jgi:hypothetical protein
MGKMGKSPMKKARKIHSRDPLKAIFPLRARLLSLSASLAQSEKMKKNKKK